MQRPCECHATRCIYLELEECESHQSKAHLAKTVKNRTLLNFGIMSMLGNLDENSFLFILFRLFLEFLVYGRFCVVLP